jgi:hypothetical protein
MSDFLMSDSLNSINLIICSFFSFFTFPHLLRFHIHNLSQLQLHHVFYMCSTTRSVSHQPEHLVGETPTKGKKLLIYPKSCWS